MSLFHYFPPRRWLKSVEKNNWDNASRKTTLTMTPVTLSLPLIFPLLLLLILHDENRQIAIHCMCRHATGDVAADNADRRTKWFFNWGLVKILTYSSLSLIITSFIRKGTNMFISNCPLIFFDVFHALKLPSSSSSTNFYPVAFPNVSPRHPERETTITFHQRLSQYFPSTSSKQDRGYWSPGQRRLR